MHGWMCGPSVACIYESASSTSPSDIRWSAGISLGHRASPVPQRLLLRKTSKRGIRQHRATPFAMET